MAEYKCGRLGMHTLSHCADRAAHIIAELLTPHAVCIAPDGHVTVESTEQAIPCEIVGVYDRTFGVFKLWGMIEDDLRCAATERHIIGGTRQRQVVRNGARRAA